jgi:hypothetical protein
MDKGVLTAHAWVEVDDWRLDDVPNGGDSLALLRPLNQRDGLVPA